jgi:hypothetical protein
VSTSVIVEHCRYQSYHVVDPHTLAAARAERLVVHDDPRRELRVEAEVALQQLAVARRGLERVHATRGADQLREPQRRVAPARTRVDDRVARPRQKLGLPPSEDGHRRVLAVLTYLRSE